MECETKISHLERKLQITNSEILNYINDFKQRTWRDIFKENKFEPRINLFIELGVETIRVVTLIRPEDMKEIHKFSFIELCKLRVLQIQCVMNLGITQPPTPLVSESLIKVTSKIPKYKFSERLNYKGLGTILVTKNLLTANLEIVQEMIDNIP